MIDATHRKNSKTMGLVYFFFSISRSSKYTFYILRIQYIMRKQNTEQYIEVLNILNVCMWIVFLGGSFSFLLKTDMIIWYEKCTYPTGWRGNPFQFCLLCFRVQ